MLATGCGRWALLEVQMQGTQLRYVIKFVADMDKALKFYRDVVGLTLKFESPGWSEFVTGETTFALHPASREKSSRQGRTGLHCRRCGGFLPRHERQGRGVQHAAEEAGFWWGAGTVR
jgi:catechol 2,3-dioxygenase-like lactoylglutathione lyase family enzyme